MKRFFAAITVLVLALSLFACGKSTAEKWQEQYDTGMKFLTELNYEEAIIAFTAAIKIDPKNAEAYLGRAEAYVTKAKQTAPPATEIKDWPEELVALYKLAENDYLAAIGLDKEWSEAYLKLADLYIEQGEMDKAMELLQQGFDATGDTALSDYLEQLKAEPLTVLVAQKAYEANGTLCFSICYSYNEAGYLIRSQQDGSDRAETWEYDGSGSCVHTRTDGTREELTNIQPGTWLQFSSIGHICTSPKTLEDVGEDGILENWNDNPDPNVAPRFAYAEYTFDEAGYSTYIVTYGEDGSVIGTAICEWETIIPKNVPAQSSAAAGSDTHKETQEEPEQSSSPEPGSDEFFRTAVQHLNPNINFDFAIDGTPLAGSDIYTIAALLGGRVNNQGGDLSVWVGPASANKFGWSNMDGVDRIELLGVLGNKEEIRIWPSEYFAGIAATDTLDQALEKLGFTEEERAYLVTCGEISLHYNPENDYWNMSARPADSAGTTPGQCSLNLYGSKKCSYCFDYSMDKAGLGRDTPVDGRAELEIMAVVNQKKK